MRKIIIASLLWLLMVGETTSTVPQPIREIPLEGYNPVIPHFGERVKPSLPAPEIIVIEETKKPSVPKAHEINGIASWYCKSGISRCTIGHPNGFYAAIRRDLLDLRGTRVLVCSSDGCVRVKIIDCNCGPNANLIDLYWDAFNAIGNPGLGIMKVTISW